ncbi:hypothetical protein CANCADRAFT_43761 [Tortispora caseinolytica NRRL Y-17796]|uniref:Nuclear speckle splicing regulatory protein 1 N-terminal domain-containing protein n=1 Tax=Tortispora caseinolytica NRRL Y-17796 TaxID=767744 RepID=A0A1E4TEE1_9ASCO|nr:hypothetical protein CANCADRAFT_43761 [Tortispora caseinolytica NRRL Y-17796]
MVGFKLAKKNGTKKVLSNFDFDEEDIEVPVVSKPKPISAKLEKHVDSALLYDDSDPVHQHEPTKVNKQPQYIAGLKRAAEERNKSRQLVRDINLRQENQKLTDKQEVFVTDTYKKHIAALDLPDPRSNPETSINSPSSSKKSPAEIQVLRERYIVRRKAKIESLHVST